MSTTTCGGGSPDSALRRDRTVLVGRDVGRARLHALVGAAKAGLSGVLVLRGEVGVGETALLALWTLADAGTAGPSLADSVRIVHALALAGLTADARALAVEGLLAAK